MRKAFIWTIVGSAILPIAALSSGSVGATNIGNEGCTPGYWKNHTDNWFEDVGQPINSTTKTLAKAGFVTVHSNGADLLLTALSYQGGPGAAGAERILLRAAAAGWLNAAHEGLGYPWRRNNDPGNLVATVNAAIQSGNREAMLALAAEIDGLNNLGCPLN
jgi:hypothetical protein